MITRTAADDVALLTIDRHERRNALDAEHCDAIGAAVTAAHADGARVVVLTGAGSTFCAGADLGGVHGGAFTAALNAMVRVLVEVPVPVIAAVNGPAIGAGTQLAAACDLRVVAPTARFAVPTARHGLAADARTVRRIASVAGISATRAMLVGADTLDAGRALACGLADRPGDLDVALAWARDLAGCAPLSLAYSKLALRTLFEPDGPMPAELVAAYDAVWAAEDVGEARQARLDKRAPHFRGR